MLPSPDQAYPPFSPLGQHRFDALMVKVSRLSAEKAREHARQGLAEFVGPDHVELVEQELIGERRAERVPVALVCAIVSIAGAAVLAGIKEWQWANVALAGLLLVVVVVLWRRRD